MTPAEYPLAVHSSSAILASVDAGFGIARRNQRTGERHAGLGIQQHPVHEAVSSTAARANRSAPPTSPSARCTSDNASAGHACSSSPPMAAPTSAATIASALASSRNPRRASTTARRPRVTAAFRSWPRRSSSGAMTLERGACFVEPAGAHHRLCTVPVGAQEVRPAEIDLDLARGVEHPPRIVDPAGEHREHGLPLHQLRTHGRPHADVVDQPTQQALARPGRAAAIPPPPRSGSRPPTPSPRRPTAACRVRG